MTRGLGRLQREIYDALPFPEKKWMLLSDLYGQDPTPARKAAVRRAVAGLQKRGLVEVAWADRPLGTGKGGRPRRVRLALDPAERAEAQRRARELLDAMEAFTRGETVPGFEVTPLGIRDTREEHE
jgi:hypothetical protein